MTGQLLTGFVPYGIVTIEWANGVPLRAIRTDIADQWTQIPSDFWQNVVTHARQDQWAPFAYIARLESSYSETVDVLDSNNERARGAMQINGINRQYDNDTMLRYGPNIAAAQTLYDGDGNYAPWYNSASLLGLPGGDGSHEGGQGNGAPGDGGAGAPGGTVTPNPASLYVPAFELIDTGISDVQNAVNALRATLGVSSPGGPPNG